MLLRMKGKTMLTIDTDAKKIKGAPINAVPGVFHELNSDAVSRAMHMAKVYHAGQTRIGAHGKVSYFDEHVMGVYRILKDECKIMDEEVLVMALLHDTVEDTECTFEMIEKCFGRKLMEQVKLLTRIEGEPFSIYARRLFANGDCKTILVKMADRLHNLRTILYMSDKRWIRKKTIQTYTDILNPLPDTLKRIDDRYNDQIMKLADKIEEQLLVIQRTLDIQMPVNQEKTHNF